MSPTIAPIISPAVAPPQIADPPLDSPLIVFGTGYFTIPQLVKAGIGVNIIGVILISILTLLLARPLFGI